ncbi:RHS repeat-associated core domain-containing protein [Pelagicoccus sp. SDUM812002]|uniref:RHS repeat domain-containing protein n=1 Tax=Pelagicoccus sp. SDUM812002 TaxID=3041266 RepID=UPI0028102310|nr:RHS repeat-associated core domain-containing protein [Pelagicoccus sp. SDUM812002]MDQ8184658.1 RHS repeat-associated core domain-containing protein [Pelagicoccus sp. SDUM812002]
MYDYGSNSLNDQIKSGGGHIYYNATYDKLGQVKTWDTTRETGTESSYTWDAAGNPTGFDGTTLTYNGFNQSNQHGYDADGSLTSDGTWTYSYDANNRLHRMTKSGKSLEFKYDYMGRRVEKKVWDSGPKSLTTESHWASGQSTHLKFAYQGMELVAEMDASGGMRKSFHWGLDKSESRGGAGGAMGLLMWCDYQTGKTYYPSYDLNGNVTGLLDDTGTWVAWYEYDAFGKLETSGEPAIGGMKNKNPIRFSTQYTDDETGLVYYGFRYYDPSKGRFLTRDPIGEAGGLNLHRFVGNDPVNRVDAFGLYWFEWCAGYEATMKWDSKLFGFKVQSTGRCGNWSRVWIPEGESYASIPYKSGTQQPTDGNPTYGNPADGEPPPAQKDQWDEKRCAELKSQIGNLELSVQRAQESIDGARNRSNDPDLLETVRRGNRGLALAGGILGTYGKKQWQEIGGIWASNSAAFVSLHDQFISASVNFRDGDIGGGFQSAGEFIATGANTILSNVKSKAAWKQLFKRAGAWITTPTEIAATGALEIQQVSIASQQLNWARQDIEFFSGLKVQKQGKVDQARSDYAEHCE